MVAKEEEKSSAINKTGLGVKGCLAKRVKGRLLVCAGLCPVPTEVAAVIWLTQLPVWEGLGFISPFFENVCTWLQNIFVYLQLKLHQNPTSPIFGSGQENQHYMRTKRSRDQAYIHQVTSCQVLKEGAQNLQCPSQTLCLSHHSVGAEACTTTRAAQYREHSHWPSGLEWRDLWRSSWC